MNTVELKNSIHNLLEEARNLVNPALEEKRDLNEEEQKRYDEIQEELSLRKKDLEDLNERLEKMNKQLSEEEEKRNLETKETQKNTQHRSMNYILDEIRNATQNFQHNGKVDFRAITNSDSTSGNAHDAVVEQKTIDILEPLYADSLLNQLNVDWYTNIKGPEIKISTMGPTSVLWESEIASAQAGQPTFGYITLTPKRLCGYVEYSRTFLALDTANVEEKIRRDLVNKLDEKLQETIFGSAAGSTTKPAGLLYNQTFEDAATFADICGLEADLKKAKVGANTCYILSPSAEAHFRSTIKGTNATGMVMENGKMDGKPTFVSPYIADDKFVYGAADNLVIASWGDSNLDVEILPLTDTVRITINARFDYGVKRPGSFVYGNVDVD